MKVVYLVENVDCAVCASNLENAIKKLSFIKSATLDFVKLKLYVETVDNFSETETELTKKLQLVTTKVLPNVTIKNLSSLSFVEKRRKQLGQTVEERKVEPLATNHKQISDAELEQKLNELKLENVSENQADNSLDIKDNKTEENIKSKKLKNKKLSINFLSKDFIRIYLCLFFFILGLALPIDFYIKLPFYLIAYIVIGYDVVISAVKNLFKGKLLDEKFLMSLASIAAFAIGEHPEAVMVMLLYQIGELFSDNAVEKTRVAIDEIVNLKAETANLVVNGEIKVVDPEELQVGDLILIKVGEKVPTDVKISKGESNFDVSSITGESVPAFKTKGEQVLSGSINLSGAVYAVVENEFKNSTVSKILELVENNGANKSRAENFITKFARFYTPIVVLIAVVLFACFPLYGTVIEGIKSAAVFLVISCPCALVISVPLTYFCGLGLSAKNGLLIKGANVLDNINSLKAICFDKTGTLTYGKFVISEVNAINCDTDEMLKHLQLAESISNHPIAKCITEGKTIDTSLIKNSKEILGQGVLVNLNNGNRILAGNEKLLNHYKVPFNPEQLNGSIIYVALNKRYLGYVVITDEIKSDAKAEIEKLNASGIKTIMLTGDNLATAEYVAASVGLTEVHSNLLPQDKVSCFNEVKQTNKYVAFVGDGVNDAPVLSGATVGYSMGLNGSDSAIDCSDVVIMTDNLKTVNDSIKIARATRRLAIENIVFSLAIKFAIMILTIFGFRNMYLAVFADVGVSIIAILNAIRIFTVKLSKKPKNK